MKAPRGKLVTINVSLWPELSLLNLEYGTECCASMIGRKA
jgi:hypothetical protein